MKNLIYILSIVVIASCSPSMDSNSLPIIFDLNNYLSQNIDSLDSIKPLVKKRIVMNDGVENIESDSINFKKELNVFNAIKWNPKQALRYKIDSVINGQKLNIEYTSLDSNLSIQKMMIEKLSSLSDLTARVRIIRKVDRPIYGLNQEFYFEPASGCYVKGNQSVPNVYDQDYEVYYQWD